MRKLISFFSCFLFIAAFCFAQEEVFSDSINVDSVVVERIFTDTTAPKNEKYGAVKSFFKKGYPNPTKAMVFSFVIPGSGQIYNKKYWKVPIVWGAYGLMIYFIDFSTGQYHFFRDEYIYCVDDEPGTVSQLKTQKGWGEDDIKSERDLYRKRMELSYVGLAAVALLSGVDAFVDAHLKGFDVSDDLTMKVGPKVDYTPYEGSTLGVGLSLHFNKKNKKPPKVFFADP